MYVSATSKEVLEGLHKVHAEVNSAQRELLRWIRACDESRLFIERDCRDTVHFIALELGITLFKARRMLACSYLIDELPTIERYLVDGVLSLDKVIELVRLATPETERKLADWARSVAISTIRLRADEERRIDDPTMRDARRWRELRWWKEDDGQRLGLYGSFPVDQGTKVVKALDRLAEQMPDSPIDRTDDDGNRTNIDVRRADALVALASAHLADNQKNPKAAVSVHVPLDALIDGDRNATMQGGTVVHPKVAELLACDASLRFVLEGGSGTLGIGRSSRLIPQWLRDQVEHRDAYCCSFPGCEFRRFLNVHHIEPWAMGGETELNNLALVCSIHHELLHLFGWQIFIGADGRPRWLRPGGREYLPGPDPPQVRLPERATQLQIA